jgi:site-specific recombinase
METLLQRYLQENSNPAMLMAALVAKIRPPKASSTDHAIHMIRALCHILGGQAEFRAAMRNALLDLLGTHKPISLYVESGVLPNTGFFSELHRRISHKLLPDAIDPRCLKDIFALIFTRQDDGVWVDAVPDACWLELLTALRFDEQLPEAGLPTPLRGVLDAVLVLSYRISSIGLEPGLVRNEPALEGFASPFLAQNDEVGEYLEQFAQAWANPEFEFYDEKHILVLLDQCKQIIQNIRRTASRSGTSISLTFLLQRLTQQLWRMEHLLAILAELRQDKSGNGAQPMVVDLFKTLVSGECHKNDVRRHWRESMELLALRVTENAGRTGEHYITSTRAEYFTLLRSAMGAGVVIAFMAVLKLLAARQAGVLFGLPVDIRHITFSAAYLGFSLVGLDFALEPQVLLLAVLGVVLIGFTNLMVSFALALSVAMKARKVTFVHWSTLLDSLGQRFREKPGEFFLPPKADPAESETRHE